MMNDGDDDDDDEQERANYDGMLFGKQGAVAAVVMWRLVNKARFGVTDRSIGPHLHLIAASS